MSGKTIPGIAWIPISQFIGMPMNGAYIDVATIYFDSFTLKYPFVSKVSGYRKPVIHYPYWNGEYSQNIKKEDYNDLTSWMLSFINPEDGMDNPILNATAFVGWAFIQIDEFEKATASGLLWKMPATIYNNPTCEIIKASQHKCSCDKHTVVHFGCKCGGI